MLKVYGKNKINFVDLLVQLKVRVNLTQFQNIVTYYIAIVFRNFIKLGWKHFFVKTYKLSTQIKKRT